MKRFMLVLALVAVAGATYVAMASGSQTAGPSAKQFAALKKQVNGLTKKVKDVEGLAIAEATLLTDCMATAAPIDRFGDTDNDPAEWGYTYTDPAVNSGTPGYRPALDLTAENDQGALWITGGSSTCGTDINGAVRKVGRMAGLRVHAAPRAFLAPRR